MSSSSGSRSVVDDVVDREASQLMEALRASLTDALKGLDASEQEVMKEMERMRQDYAMKAEAAKARVLGLAEIQAKSGFLRLFDEKADEIARMALDRIAGMKRDASYEKVAEALLREAISAVGSPSVVVKPARPDASTLKKLLARASKDGRFGEVKLALAGDVVDSVGGLIASSADGSVSYDNTFEARLGRSMESIKKALSESVKRVG